MISFKKMQYNQKTLNTTSTKRTKFPKELPATYGSYQNGRKF